MFPFNLGRVTLQTEFTRSRNRQYSATSDSMMRINCILLEAAKNCVIHFIRTFLWTCNPLKNKKKRRRDLYSPRQRQRNSNIKCSPMEASFCLDVTLCQRLATFIAEWVHHICTRFSILLNRRQKRLWSSAPTPPCPRSSRSWRSWRTASQASTTSRPSSNTSSLWATSSWEMWVLPCLY